MQISSLVSPLQFPVNKIITFRISWKPGCYFSLQFYEHNINRKSTQWPISFNGFWYLCILSFKRVRTSQPHTHSDAFPIILYTKMRSLCTVMWYDISFLHFTAQSVIFWSFLVFTLEKSKRLPPKCFFFFWKRTRMCVMHLHYQWEWTNPDGSTDKQKYIDLNMDFVLAFSLLYNLSLKNTYIKYTL